MFLNIIQYIFVLFAICSCKYFFYFLAFVVFFFFLIITIIFDTLLFCPTKKLHSSCDAIINKPFIYVSNQYM